MIMTVVKHKDLLFYHGLKYESSNVTKTYWIHIRYVGTSACLNSGQGFYWILFTPALALALAP